MSEVALGNDGPVEIAGAALAQGGGLGARAVAEESGELFGEMGGIGVAEQPGIVRAGDFGVFSDVAGEHRDTAGDDFEQHHTHGFDLGGEDEEPGTGDEFKEFGLGEELRKQDEAGGGLAAGEELFGIVPIMAFEAAHDQEGQIGF